MIRAKYEHTIMTQAMQYVSYDKKSFNFNPKQHRHPEHITEKWYVYHLIEDDNGMLICRRDFQGNPVQSPRRLRDMCILKLVSEPQLLQKQPPELLPSNCYPLMMTEAIYVREAPAIEWLVSCWPMRVLRLYDLIPLEDHIEDDYLTQPLEPNHKVSLVDCIVLGMLRLKPISNLKTIDFTRFEKDEKLCKELCRLPLLWMEPKERTVENIHENMLDTIDVSKDKLQKFLNRISIIYYNVDGDYKHGNTIDPITIELDLKINLDDVPIGLSLMKHSPFSFACHKLWMKIIPEVKLPYSNLANIINPKMITHIEIEDVLLPQDNENFNSVMQLLAKCTSLIALSLPNTVDIKNNQQMASSLNKLLRKLVYIERLNFSYCNLRGRLSTLLGGLRHRLEYLNLKDCRLDGDDISFLVHWRPLASLREFNASCNNLQGHENEIVRLVERMSLLTCFSIAHCQLNTHGQVVIARQCKESRHLKVFCLKGYTPLPQNDSLELLSCIAQVRSLQKAVIFPEVYGFPGANERERAMNRYHTFRFSYRYLNMRGRPDIELE